MYQISMFSSQSLSAGLSKAQRDEARDIARYYASKIELEPLSYPEHQREWKKGSFSWHYVRGVEHWSEYLFFFLEGLTMASRKPKQAKRALTDYAFVRCELKAEDKKAAKAWIDTNLEQFGPLAHDVMAEDYKMSVSFSSEHDTFTATLTGKEGSLNEYKMLTARHKDWVIASMTVLYKHTVIFRSKVWESEDADEDGWS